MRPPSGLRVVPRHGIESRLIDDGAAVLVDMGSGKIFELNPIGAEVWGLLKGSATVDGICDVLCKKYTVEQTVLRADVIELVSSLLEAGLVEKTTDTPNSGK